MGKRKNLTTELANCKHPNSRKMKVLGKEARKLVAKKESQKQQNLKRTVVGTKVQWFLENLPPEWSKCTAQQTQELIERYLNRFNEELEQIAIKHSIGNRKNRQHASREDVIKMTIKREVEEYTTGGLEMLNLMDANTVSSYRSWNGDLVALQHFKLVRISKKMLNSIIDKQPSGSNLNMT